MKKTTKIQLAITGSTIAILGCYFSSIGVVNHNQNILSTGISAFVSLGILAAVGVIIYALSKQTAVQNTWKAFTTGNFYACRNMFKCIVYSVLAIKLGSICNSISGLDDNLYELKNLAASPICSLVMAIGWVSMIIGIACLVYTGIYLYSGKVRESHNLDPFIPVEIREKY